MLKLAIITTVSIDRFGRLLIPKKLRDRLGLEAGKTLMFKEAGRLILEPEGEVRLRVKDGLPIFEAGADLDVQAVLEAQREERILFRAGLKPE